MARLRDDYKIKLSLVCTGRAVGPLWAEVQSLVSSLGLGEQVTFLGSVSADELAWLLLHAELMVFPSLFEGLGLPVLEALAAGLPVAAGRVTCIPDLVAGAAILFDPTDVDFIAAGIREAIANQQGLRAATLAFRPNLDRYRWRVALPRFVSFYKAAAGRPMSVEERELVSTALSP